MKLVFIQIGGTIDKDYPHSTKSWVFENGEPATNRIIKKLNPPFEFDGSPRAKKWLWDY